MFVHRVEDPLRGLQIGSLGLPARTRRLPWMGTTLINIYQDEQVVYETYLGSRVASRQAPQNAHQLLVLLHHIRIHAAETVLQLFQGSSADINPGMEECDEVFRVVLATPVHHGLPFSDMAINRGKVLLGVEASFLKVV